MGFPTRPGHHAPTYIEPLREAGWYDLADRYFPQFEEIIYLTIDQTEYAIRDGMRRYGPAAVIGLWRFMRELPSRLGVETDEFLSGYSPSKENEQPLEARATWNEWQARLYGWAIQPDSLSASGESARAALGQILSLVYDYLEQVLPGRIRFWLQRHREADNQPSGLRQTAVKTG